MLLTWVGISYMTEKFFFSSQRSKIESNLPKTVLIEKMQTLDIVGLFGSGFVAQYQRCTHFKTF